MAGAHHHRKTNRAASFTSFRTCFGSRVSLTTGLRPHGPIAAKAGGWLIGFTGIAYHETNARMRTLSRGRWHGPLALRERGRG